MQCGLCRQRFPGGYDLDAAMHACGRYDDDYERLEDLPPLAVRLLDLRSSGEITEKQLYDFSEMCQRVMGTLRHPEGSPWGWPENILRDWSGSGGN